MQKVPASTLSDSDKKLIEEYEAKSKSDAYVGYNSLQCAADDENLEAFRALLKQATRADLEYVNSTDKHPKGTNENLLDVTMKNPTLFRESLEAVNKEPNLLPKLISSKDIDGDNLLHQFVEFGRTESLGILVEAAKQDPEVQHTVLEATNHTNQEGLRPLQLAERFEESTTIRRLVDEDILSPEKLANARNNLPEIKRNLEDLHQNLQSSTRPGM